MKPSFYGMAAIAMLLLSCSQGTLKEQVATTDVSIENKTATTTQQEIPVTTKEGEMPPVPQAGTPPALVDWDKKIIKTANITMELKDFNAFDNNIHKNLRSYGAYVSEENQNNTDYKLSNVLSIKVPVDQFENLVNSLSGTGVTLVSKNITTDDVSGETIDIKARVEAKKQVRDRYLALLKQAGNTKDLLAIQQEVNGVQEQIESANGRVNYLVHQAAYSTIHLTYYQLLTGISEKDITPPFFARLGTAFAESFGVVSNLLLFVVYCWPLWVVLITAFLLYKKRRQLRLNKSN
jgi:hypothetical protein